MSIVYALCDPNALEVRYVGKTVRAGSERLRNHINDARRGRTIVANWIRKVDRPVLVVLEQDPEDLDAAERRWIADLRAAGARLANMTEGGTGGPTFTGRKHSAEARARISVGQMGNVRGPLSPEHRARVSESLRGRRFSVEHRERIAAAARRRGKS